MAKQIKHELVEDVEHMLSIATPHQVLRSLGRSAASVHRTLYRADRPDLARPFGRIAWEQRQEAGYVRPRDRKAA